MVLSPDDKNYIEDLFSKELRDPVKLIIFKKEGWKYLENLREVLDEIVSLSGGLLSYEIHDYENEKDLVKKYNVDKAPIILITRNGEDLGVRFAGTPFGYEFSTFLEAIINVSKKSTDLPNDVKELIKKINEPVKIEVYVTPSCPYCPNAVATAHKFAIENEYIIGEGVEAYEHEELANKYGVSAVPHIVINNGARMFVGAYPPKEFALEILKAIRKA
ncbi:MAG: glutaredoxin [Thermoplasmata archaeon]|nr:thioredoxin family protein [Euryarchaeota archaeon]RLF64588.1 MAG: glutaredoxin [Thermoplasmata archaeon]